MHGSPGDDDSGGSHLAAAVGAPMLVFRESDTWSRDLRVLMKERNPNVCEVVPDDAGAWNRPEVVIDAALKQLQIANCKSQIPCAQAN